MIIDHRVIHWDIIDKPINPKHVPTGLNPLIQSLEVTVGTFNFNTQWGFTPNTGSISPASAVLADGSSSVVESAYVSTTFLNVIFEVSGEKVNTDLSAFKELVIYDGATELVTLQRSDAVFSITPQSDSSWNWNVATNYFGTTVGATRTIELRR